LMERTAYPLPCCLRLHGPTASALIPRPRTGTSSTAESRISIRSAARIRSRIEGRSETGGASVARPSFAIAIDSLRVSAHMQVRERERPLDQGPFSRRKARTVSA
jgi:hypothetical protein